MTEPISEPFRMTVSAFSGVTGEGFDALLSSLPSELCFNDLRDGGRRHSRFEKTDPSNLHAVCIKSVMKRPGGAKTLELEDADWMTPLKGKTLRTKVHQALRAKDVDLGINCEGLTRHRTNKAYTRPHVFCDRLRLLQVLQAVWDSTPGSSETKGDAVLHAYKNSWTSKLVPNHCFIRWPAEDPMQNERIMVVNAGPFAVRLLSLTMVPESCPVGYTFKDSKAPRQLKFVGDLEKVEIALCQPALDKSVKLMWTQSTNFMSLSQYIADYSIQNISHALLSKVCSAAKLKGHTKLSHKKRVEAFLTFMEKDQGYINSILEDIPEHGPRKKKEAEASFGISHHICTLPVVCF